MPLVFLGGVSGCAVGRAGLLSVGKIPVAGIFRCGQYGLNEISKMKQPVVITAELTPENAQALARFVKNISHEGIRACSSDDAETFLVRDALDSLREALDLAGFDPV